MKELQRSHTFELKVPATLLLNCKFYFQYLVGGYNENVSKWQNGEGGKLEDLLIDETRGVEKERT